MSINLEIINPGDSPNDGRVKINRNFTAITDSLNEPSFLTISASTIYSGSTNLYDIFLTSADGNDITRVQSGLNTYTGGSANFPVINISAATLNYLNVSGNTILSSLTATTAYLIGTGFGSGTNVLKTINSTGGTTFEVVDSGFIRLTDPSFNLELIPNGASTLTEFNTSNVGFQLTSTQGYLRVNRATSGTFLLYPNSNVTRVDLTGDFAGTPLLSMTTIANGFNVGINNTTPVEKLDVNGGTNISGGLTAATLTINTGGTAFLNVTTSGQFLFSNGNGTSSQIEIHQDASGRSRILDVYNNSYSKQLFVISDNGSAGQVYIGDGALQVNAYGGGVGVGIGGGVATKFAIRGDAATFDIFAALPYNSSGGVYMAASATYHPYIYLQNSGGTSTQVVIASDGNSYFSAGNIGVNTINPAALLDLSGGTGYAQLRLRTSYTPSSSGDTNGNIGDIAWDDSYIYMKTNTGWGRSQLSYGF
jgi:hypothetical protein